MNAYLRDVARTVRTHNFTCPTLVLVWSAIALDVMSFLSYRTTTGCIIATLLRKVRDGSGGKGSWCREVGGEGRGSSSQGWAFERLSKCTNGPHDRQRLR